MFGCVLRKYYTLRCKIDGETEYVGPCIVPGNVQIKFAPRNLLEINVRCNQSLAPFERPGEHFSEGRDDHAATTDQSSVGRVPMHWLEISRAVCAREILARTDPKHRPSYAMWRMLTLHISRSSTVDAHQICTPPP